VQLDDQAIFPQQYGVPFPQNFVDVVKVIFKRLFRVYAHIYHSHFKHVCSLGEEAHLNTCFKHFMYFAQASAVMAERHICRPLATLVTRSAACRTTAQLSVQRCGKCQHSSCMQVFELIEQRELAPLQQLIDQMVT
jgi:Mob1/phocein family